MNQIKLLTTSSIATSKISTLNHEVFDNSMEFAALIPAFLQNIKIYAAIMQTKLYDKWCQPHGQLQVV